MKYITIIPFLLITLSLISQEEKEEINYISNPGFEKHNKLPCIFVRKASAFERALPAWKTATKTTPDIISTHVREICWAHPINRKQSMGKQLPRNGNVMVGLRTYGKGGNGAVKYWHEYIQTKLTTPLKKGEEYYIEFWVSDAIRGVRSTNNIGAYFTDTMIDTKNRLALYITPHINESKLVHNSPDSWHKISAFFTPEKEYNYITIGNFYGDQQTLNEKHDGTTPGGYYYIDDILVRPREKGDAATTGKPDKVIIPKEEPPKKEDIPEVKTSEKDLNEIDYQLGQKIKLDNIFFETDKSTLKPESTEELDKLVKILNDNPNIKIKINGHTDNVGTEKYNIKLSKNRAAEVEKYLVKNGIKKERLKNDGYGSKKPIATNKTSAGRSQNRRVEFEITEK